MYQRFSHVFASEPQPAESPGHRGTGFTECLHAFDLLQESASHKRSATQFGGIHLTGVSKQVGATEIARAPTWS